MDVNKLVCISRNATEQWCVFAHHWCGIPVFVTRDDSQSRSALYRDGTCFIILGSDLIKIRNPQYLYNRLWLLIILHKRLIEKKVRGMV